MKAGAGEPVAIVKRRPAQKIRAFAINEKFDAILGHDRVAGLTGIERHFVLQPGAAALGNAHAKALLLGHAARFKEAAQLPNCILRYGNHRLGKIIVFLRNRKSPT